MFFTSGIPSREEICARKAHLFSDDPVFRLNELTAVVVKHIEDCELYSRYIRDIEVNYNRLVRNRLDRVSDEVERAVRRGIERPPNVQLIIDPTTKGNLRMSYLPERPRDFGHMVHEYRHHAGRDPINTLLFIDDFQPLWAAQSKTSSDPDSDLHLALMREILITVVSLTEFTAERLAKICNVTSRWRFVREPSGQFVLLSPQEIEDWAKASAAAKERAAIEKIEAPQREQIKRWSSQYGMEPGRIVALVEAFSPCRVPFNGRVKILRRHFDLKGSPGALSPGTVRSMKNTLARLNMPLPDAEITLDEARWLAQHYLGRIRERPHVTSADRGL